MSKQKRLDKPELREKITDMGEILLDAKADKDKIPLAIKRLKALIPDIEPPKDLAGATVAITEEDIIWYQKIEEAKKQEVQRIGDWGEQDCDCGHHLIAKRRECRYCWQALKEEK